MTNVLSFPARRRDQSSAYFGLAAYPDVSSALADHVGDEHMYVLYPARIAAAARAFLDRLPAKTLYAVKANPHPAVIQTLLREGVSAFDVASIREIDAIRTLAPKAELFVMHPVKSRGLIRHAFENGARGFSLDCPAELEKIRTETNSADDLSLFVRVALPKGAAAMPLAGKFGADFETAISLLRAARPAAKTLGVCFHVGSQCLDPQDYDNAIRYARRIVDESGVDIESLDVGGGFPATYPGMAPPDLDLYFKTIQDAIAAHGYCGCEILAEPGRAMCAEGGSTLARVDLRKGADLYLNDGVYGSLFDAGHCAWKHAVKLHRSRRPDSIAPMRNFRFFGPTCDSMDVMEGPFVLPDDVTEGDWLEIEHLGAYGQAIASQFNGYYSNATVAIIEHE